MKDPLVELGFDLATAIRELDVDVPVYATRVVPDAGPSGRRGSRVELHLYGGRVLTWPPATTAPAAIDPPDHVPGDTRKKPHPVNPVNPVKNSAAAP